MLFYPSVTLSPLLSASLPQAVMSDAGAMKGAVERWTDETMRVAPVGTCLLVMLRPYCATFTRQGQMGRPARLRLCAQSPALNKIMVWLFRVTLHTKG